MANGDIPKVTVTVVSHEFTTETTIPCKDAEQSDFIGRLVTSLADAVRQAYAPLTLSDDHDPEHPQEAS